MASAAQRGLSSMAVPTATKPHSSSPRGAAPAEALIGRWPLQALGTLPPPWLSCTPATAPVARMRAEIGVAGDQRVVVDAELVVAGAAAGRHVAVLDHHQTDAGGGAPRLAGPRRHPLSNQRHVI